MLLGKGLAGGIEPQEISSGLCRGPRADVDQRCVLDLCRKHVEASNRQDYLFS